MYTLQRKTRPTWHVCFPHQFMYTWHTLPAGGPRTWQPFGKSSTVMDRATAPEKKGSRHNPYHAGWPIHGSVPSFYSEPAVEAVGIKPPSVGIQLLGLSGPYHRHVICTFNTCSRGVNPSVINWHKQGLQPWRCRLSTYHSSTFPTSCLSFPPKGPTQSQVIHPTITNWSREGSSPKSREW
jgi:hypothetical protein